MRQATEQWRKYVERPIPCRPKLRSDELFSSWIIRIALQFGMKPQSFCQMMWPSRPFWNRALDRSASSTILDSLAAITGTPLSLVEGSLLRSLEGVLFPKLVRSGNTPWILPLAIYHRMNLRSGLAFCPACLAEGEAYFRREWRLSLFTICLRHQCALLDRCPNCSSPIQPHRVGMGDRSGYTSQELHSCVRCQYDLRRTAVEEQNVDLAIHQSNFAKMLAQPNKNSPSTLDQFCVLAHLLLLLTSRRPHLSGLRKVVASERDSPRISSWESADSIRLHFDTMDLHDRRVFLGAACWLQEDWPIRFLYSVRRGNARPSDLMRDFRDAPMWYQEVCQSS